MIKLVYCLRKRDDVTSEELYRYWLNEHGPLVRKFADAIKARKYVWSHTGRCWKTKQDSLTSPRRGCS
jgi:hypothetical protein